MGKQQMDRSKKFMNLKGFWNLASHHRLVTFLVLSALVLAGIIAGYAYHSYEQKFSREDYDKLTAIAETVLRNSGGKDIEASKTCSYERPGEFGPLHLYCHVALAAYLPYKNDHDTALLARQFENQIKQVGDTQLLPDSFYAKPANNTWVAPTNLRPPYHDLQCRFAIATNHFAELLGVGLPNMRDTNLVALSFYCSAESRAEYFPVTYRQG